MLLGWGSLDIKFIGIVTIGGTLAGLVFAITELEVSLIRLWVKNRY